MEDEKKGREAKTKKKGGKVHRNAKRRVFGKGRRQERGSRNRKRKKRERKDLARHRGKNTL